MEYMVAEGFDIVELQIEVKKCIDVGYIPQGGVCRISEQGEVAFYQAMIKEKPIWQKQ